jgi:uncharacterized integral membrane protein
MGETYRYQSLTKEDIITVVLYRAGIFISCLIIVFSAFLAVRAVFVGDLRNFPNFPSSGAGIVSGVLLLLLYFGTGLSVFFIHLYVGKFHRILKKIYYASFACLIALFFIGKGNPGAPLFGPSPYSALLLIPIALCLGFVTAKEAFCFRLIEGYILAFIMPALIFFYSLGTLDQKSAAFGLAIVALMLVFFMLRKIFMPIHFDIGDKSAYQP